MALKTYKALSVVEPWGDFIACGKKTIKVRTWITDQIRPDEDLLIVQNKKILTEDGMTDAEGCYAWVLTDLRPVRGRVPCLAARKIYEVELESLVVES